MTRLFRPSWAQVSNLHSNAARPVLRSPLLTPGNGASTGLSVSPTINKWWSWNQNTGLFCIKAGVLSTLVYYRKEGITGAPKPLYSFFFQGRAENSSAFPCWRWLLRRTVAEPPSQWLDKLPSATSSKGSGDSKHHPLGCFVPFKQGQGSPLWSSPLPEFFFSFPHHMFKHCQSFRVWSVTLVTPKSTQLPRANFF